MKSKKLFIALLFAIILAGSSLFSCKMDNKKAVEPQVNVEGIMFALLRNVDQGVLTTDKVHGYAIMDFNPFSENFGDTLQTVYGPLGHHGYISPINGGLYITQASDLAARVDVTIEANGLPKIQNIRPPIEDGDMRVGEDIVWFKENGQDRYAITSMDGLGNDTLGGICIYDANTDKLLKTITDAKQLRYSHGISLFDDKPVGLVTSVIHEDIALYGIPSVDSLGHEVALIDFSTGKIIKNYDLGTTEAGFPVAPVECAIFRKSFNEAFDGNEKAMVIEMVSGNIVSANWNEANQLFDDFQVVYSPKDEKEYFPLEIYVDDSKIYITYAEKVKTFDLKSYADSGQLVDAGVEYITKSCAHHLSFFDTNNPDTGEKVPVLLVHQNLLNLGQQPFNIRFGLPIELGMHEVTAYNRETGDVLKTVNIYDKLGVGIEYVGGFNENAYAHHH